MSETSPAARLRQFIQRTLNRRPVRLGLQIAVVAASLAYLAGSLRGAGSTLAGQRINYAWLGAAWALTVATVFVGALAWWLVLRGLGQAVGWPQAARAHLFSNLAKYLPGYAWQLVGKAVLTKQIGVPARAVGASMLIELMQLVVIGLGLALSLVPEAVLGEWGVGRGLAGAVRLASWLLIGAVAAAGWWLRALAGRLRRLEADEVRPLALLASAAAILGGWLSFGVSFWLIGAAFAPVSLASVPLFTFTLAVSLLVSLAVVIIPGGIGVRESVMVWLLAPYVSAPLAVVIAGVSRLVLLLSEFFAAYVFDGVRILCIRFAGVSPNVDRKPAIRDQ